MKAAFFSATLFSSSSVAVYQRHRQPAVEIRRERRKMGNCQAAEVATVVIQHPGGRVERLYWPTSAADVMKSNPGYHVALVTLYVSETKTDSGAGTVRFTRVRLLKPRDVLLLGQVYRLITSQGSIRAASRPFPDSLLVSLIPDALPEVAKALRQRKHEKLKKSQAESIRKQQQEQQHGTNDQGTDPARQETEEDSDATHQVHIYCNKSGEGSAKEQHAGGSKRPPLASFASEHLRSRELIVQPSQAAFTTQRPSLDGLHTQVSGMIVMERSIPSKKELRFRVAIAGEKSGRVLVKIKDS
ncbi:hypothetical protein MUK42_06955 [Musa troglodytarum]|uniref:Uncharacterized protein n=1 Tax=Musa troglodytarum TaxID=320322 RepID=A0A9E7KUE1_9LILI|nr:hypothetical protein MUK42_06955 [Musa troglodytarum]